MQYINKSIQIVQRLINQFTEFSSSTLSKNLKSEDFLCRSPVIALNAYESDDMNDTLHLRLRLRILQKLSDKFLRDDVVPRINRETINYLSF